VKLNTHIPPSSAEVKNGGAIPPLPSVFMAVLNQVIKQKDSFTFYCVFLVIQGLRTKKSSYSECVVIDKDLHILSVPGPSLL
jgi:hypothetical protein